MASVWKVVQKEDAFGLCLGVESELTSGHLFRLDIWQSFLD